MRAHLQKHYSKRLGQDLRKPFSGWHSATRPKLASAHPRRRLGSRHATFDNAESGGEISYRSAADVTEYHRKRNTQHSR